MNPLFGLFSFYDLQVIIPRNLAEMTLRLVNHCRTLFLGGGAVSVRRPRLEWKGRREGERAAEEEEEEEEGGGGGEGCSRPCPRLASFSLWTME